MTETQSKPKPFILRCKCGTENKFIPIEWAKASNIAGKLGWRIARIKNSYLLICPKCVNKHANNIRL